jgi:hypothetical protein
MIARDRALPIRIRGDQAGIRCEALTTDQPLGEATGNNAFEKAPKDIAVPEPSVPITRER